MKKIILVFLFLFFLGCVPVAIATSFVIWQVYAGNYADFEKSKIIDILSKETVLYYADGQSQLGSLFGQEHRIYVGVDLVPQVMKDAIVSAEDEDFYTNIGIEPKGILRAAVHNLIFRTRQGASTITQQTVKNLFGRRETDLYIKFQEMINAFKLEKMYSKDQILEFYLNQFHVTGNGRGVGVAAKYYFNKNVEDLSLIEAAFIAGSVKAPEKYNPFTKITVNGQEKARNEARIRKNYVLNRMFKNQKITAQQLEDSLKESVPFNQGRFQFNELAVNQIISKQLARPEVLQAIGANNVDEVGTMGLHITTTLEKDIQNAAQYGLRQNLSRIQLILNGFSAEPQSNFMNIQKPEENGFYVGKIESIERIEDAEKIRISFGIPTCVVNTEAINRVSLIMDQSFKKGLKKSRDAFLSSVHIGQYVLASVKNITPEGIMFCDIESRPRVQGAVIVLDKGRIIAMAGGFSSSEYNRAVFAERQPGSSFKLTAYYAAQQLGWTVLDPLSNMRDVFTWQNVFYFPRPDHAPSSLETTILGAGAKSENLASIWILRHLTDKLNYDQFLDLLNFLGITGNGMSKEQSLALIAKKFNATPDNEYYLKHGILEKIKADLLSDLSVFGNNRLKVFLRTLHFGNGFEKQEQIIIEDKDLTPKEKDLRINLLKNNLLRFNKLAAQAKNAIEALKETSSGSAITEIDRDFLLSFAKSEDGALVFQSQDPWRPEVTSNLVTGIKTTPLSIDALLTLIRANSSILNSTNILLDGVVPLSLIETINSDLAKYWKNLQEASPFEKLFWNADFRYSLGMYYTANMSNSMGIQKPLKWVQSFPLGSNDITLSDLALMYQTFLTGKTYRYFNSVQPNQLVLIKRIEDSNGNLLWEAKAKEYQFADRFYSPSMMNVLRGTVTAGTAYVLNNEIILRSNDEVIDKQLQAAKIRIPVFGKTGTTNDYKNGTYIGFIPYPASNGDVLSPDNAYTIASYIGYDTNEPMIRKGYRVYGGGAIPAWQEIALSIIKNQNFAEKLDWKYWAEKKAHVVPFEFGSNLSQVIVPINSGVSLANQETDDDNAEEKNPYANDYSETGRRLFKIYITGSSSDNVFIPKRKVSFYTPVPPPQNIFSSPNSNEVSDVTASLNNKPVVPEPLTKSTGKLDFNEDKSSLNSADDEELPKAKTGAKNYDEELPLPPPSLQIK
ncbi:transglycosylase domain-containing protein [Fluviispira multicolorata]|nr:transglycosylase domain-containing protein [Fluviispira multicolorata]